MSVDVNPDSLPLPNLKHERFAQLVCENLHKNEAYVQAGYTGKNIDECSSRLMTTLSIRRRIDFIRTEQQARRNAISDAAIANAGITKEWVIKELVENVRMAKAAEPVLDSKGNPTGEYRVDLAGANKALELIGKELGMFTVKLEVADPNDNPLNRWLSKIAGGSPAIAYSIEGEFNQIEQLVEVKEVAEAEAVTETSQPAAPVKKAWKPKSK